MTILILTLTLLSAASLCHAHGGTHGDGAVHMDQKLAEGDWEITDKEVNQDMEHIKEHYENVKLDESKISEQEREWLFFKSHDKDNNTMLDGLEILQAIRHIQNEHKTPEDIKKLNVTEELIQLTDHIDRTFESMDLNLDGYISYSEYQIATRARREEDKKTAAENEKGEKEKAAPQQ